HLQRPDRDTGRVHVDHHRGDALVLGRVRVGPHRGQPEAGLARTAGPDLLAVDPPAVLDLGRPGLDAGRVGPGARLAEQLAPDDVLVERRTDPACHLVRSGVLDQGEDDPAGDTVGGALDTGRRQLPLDYQRACGTHAPAP